MAKDGSATGNTDWLFDYDPVGNRLSQQASDNSSHILYSYRADSNRLTETNSVVITGDAAGNTLNDGRLQYQYDGMNRLSEVSDIQSGLQSNYTYNALGQRVRKQVNDQAAKDIRYVYGLTGELLGEYNPDGTRINEYVYHTENGTPELIAKIDAADNIVYIHGDHLGTPRLATSSSKTVVWRWQSDAFGVGLANEDPDNNGELVTTNHRFPGQYYDQESGQHYNYFRDYDPSLGRYIQSDPRGILLDYSDPQRQIAAQMGLAIPDYGYVNGLNHLYGYTGQNPLMYTDPTGETPAHAARGAFWVGGRIGAGINYGIQAATGASLGSLSSVASSFKPKGSDSIDFIIPTITGRACLVVVGSPRRNLISHALIEPSRKGVLMALLKRLLILNRYLFF